MQARTALLALGLVVLSRVAWAQEANPCHPDIPCDDGECIPRDKWCDDWDTCWDGTDEKYCKKKGYWFSKDYKCNETLHFPCKNGRCVPGVLECDGFDDCGDNSDEKNCPKVKQVTQPEERSSTSKPDSLTTQTTLSSREYPDRGSGPDSDVTAAPLTPREYHNGESLSYPDSRATQPPFNPNEYYSRVSSPFPDPRATRAPINPNDYHSRVDMPFPDPRATRAPINPNDYHSRVNMPFPDPRATRAPFNPNEYHGRVNLHYPYPRATRTSFSEHDRRGLYDGGAWPLPVFRFEEARPPSVGRRALVEAERWLLKQEVTPRVLVALSLARNSLRPNTTQYEVMRRRLKLQLGAKLFRRQAADPVNAHQMSASINALLATCQDPRQVYGQDLVSMLRSRATPAPFVLLTLCLANASLTDQDFGFLRHLVESPINDEVSKDRFILSTSALACIHKRGLYANELRSVLGTASRKLLELQYDDGSFGSIYSTALAAQALFALESREWNPEPTLDFVIGHQSPDGSFGDLLATTSILPILSGRSLLHLRETQCEKPKHETTPEDFGRNTSGPRKTVWYSLAAGSEHVTRPVTVPQDANFFEIMQEAERGHPTFRFLHTETFGKLDVYSLSGVPNDPERGTYWLLFVPDPHGNGNRIYNGDIRQLIPGDNEELVYRYLPRRSIFPSTRYGQP